MASGDKPQVCDPYALLTEIMRQLNDRGIPARVLPGERVNLLNGARAILRGLGVQEDRQPITPPEFQASDPGSVEL